MDIFYKRPLSLILCITLGGFLLFSFLGESYSLIAFIILLPLSVILAVRKAGRVTALLLSLSLSLALLYSGVYWSEIFYPDEDLSGRVDVVALVLDIDESREYENILTLNTVSVGGEEHSYKMLAAVKKNATSGVTPRSTVSFSAELRNIGRDRNYHTAKGLSAEALDVRDLAVISVGDGRDLTVLRETVTRRAVMLSGAEAGGLFAALFTGEREWLSDSILLSFTRIGVNHVLALSGMHLAILSALLKKLLGLLGLGKRMKYALTSLIIIGYMSMTGFSSSVTRSGIMLIIAGALFIFSARFDSVTSLSAAVSLIVLIEPYAIYDVGLWLSALATLGVIEARHLGAGAQGFFSEVLSTKRKRRARDILVGVLATVLAVGATLLVTISFFPGISPLSIVTTPIFSLLAEVYIYLGLFILAFGDVLPVGGLLSPLYSLMLSLSEWLSKTPVSYFSTVFTAVKILAVIFTVCFVFFIVARLRHRWIAFGILASLLVSTFATAGVMTVYARYDDGAIYTRGERSECILIRSQGECAVIDLASGNASSSEDIKSILYTSGAVEVDRMIFAYYSSNLPSRVSAAVGNTLTGEVLIPRPENEAETKIAEETAELLRDAGIRLVYYGTAGKIAVGDAEISEIHRSHYGEGAATSVIKIEQDGECIVYLSSGVLNGENGGKFAADSLMKATHLILGRGGRGYSEPYQLTVRYSKIKSITLSGEMISLSQSAAMFYTEKGTKIYAHPTSVELIP